MNTGWLRNPAVSPNEANTVNEQLNIDSFWEWLPKQSQKIKEIITDETVELYLLYVKEACKTEAAVPDCERNPAPAIRPVPTPPDCLAAERNPVNRPKAGLDSPSASVDNLQSTMNKLCLNE
jgi:hypothetical protein